MSKKAAKPKSTNSKSATKTKRSSDDQTLVVWVFDNVDKDGVFSFSLDKIKSDNNLELVFDKMMQYETMTWQSVKQQTHDKKGKSKHHTLAVQNISKNATYRINKLKLEDYTECIFSFALTNKVRVIGIRENQFFHVKWYDPEHKFCISEKKHT